MSNKPIIISHDQDIPQFTSSFCSQIQEKLVNDMITIDCIGKNNAIKVLTLWRKLCDLEDYLDSNPHKMTILQKNYIDLLIPNNKFKIKPYTLIALSPPVETFVVEDYQDPLEKLKVRILIFALSYKNNILNIIPDSNFSSSISFSDKIKITCDEPNELMIACFEEVTGISYDDPLNIGDTENKDYNKIIEKCIEHILDGSDICYNKLCIKKSVTICKFCMKTSYCCEECFVDDMDRHKKYCKI